MPKPQALYRLFDETEQLLYLGISADPGKRFAQHRSDKPWWGDIRSMTVQPMPSREAALEAEREAIKDERPLHNVVHNERIASAAEDVSDSAFEILQKKFTLTQGLTDEGAEHVAAFHERRGMTHKEAQLVIWAEWSEHYLTELQVALEMLTAQLPFERVDPARQAAVAELISEGGEVNETRLAIKTARNIAAQMGKEYLAALPPEMAARVIAEYSFADETEWAEAAADARGWEWFAEISAAEARTTPNAGRGGDDDQ